MTLNEILREHQKWLNGVGGRQADLRGADLRGADLRDACLRGADLRGADLRKADLKDADLRDACLRGADLRGADLRKADLEDADLRDADLGLAELRCATLKGAKLPQKIIQIGPIGSRFDYTVYNVDTDTVFCGCWNDYNGGSLEEFKARIDEVYPSGRYRAEYLAAISAFELMKAAFQKEESERDKGKLAVDEDKDADAPTT